MIKKATLTLVFLAACLLLPFVAQPSAHAVDVLNDNSCSGSTSNGTSGCNGVCDNSDATSQPAICTDNQCTGSQACTASDPLIGSNGVITDVIRLVSYFLGIAAIIVIIISSIRMILAGGDANNVATARRAVIYALVGLAVAAVAQLIVTFVLSKVS